MPPLDIYTIIISNASVHMRCLIVDASCGHMYKSYVVRTKRISASRAVAIRRVLVSVAFFFGVLLHSDSDMEDAIIADYPLMRPLQSPLQRSTAAAAATRWPAPRM